jgi:hypothetical protein
MKKEEFIHNHGYDSILKNKHVKGIEDEFGAIEDIYLIDEGSTLNQLYNNEIEGYIIITKSGAIVCIESDGRTTDLFAYRAGIGRVR